MNVCTHILFMLVKLSENIRPEVPSAPSLLLNQHWFTASNSHEASSFSSIKAAQVTVDWFA